MSSPTQRSKAYLEKQGYRVAIGTCQHCGSGFVKAPRGKPYKFCSRFCAVRGRGGGTKRQKLGRFCVVCNQYFEVQKSKSKNAVYCSNECRISKIDHNGVKNPNFKDAGSRTCEGCGKGYRSYVKTRRFCSVECGWNNAPEEGMKNGRRGYDAELRCCSELSSRGYSAYRSAASRGPFDVFALGSGGAVCVQVKRTKDKSRRRQKKAVDEIALIGAPVSEHNRKQMWCWVDRTGWFVVDIQSDGSRKEGWGLDWLGLAPVIQHEINTMRDNP